IGLGTTTCQSFDTTNTGSYACFLDRNIQANLARGRAMRTSAQLDTVAHGDDTHLVLVLLAKKRHRSRRQRLLQWHDLRVNGKISAYPAVNLLVNQRYLGSSKRARAGKVKAQTLRFNQ